MDVADSFIPTGGAVGLLPMVTYFFLVVAAFAFAGLFLVALIGLISSFLNSAIDSNRSTSRFPLLLLPVVTALSSISYYILQSYYHGVLAEMVTVTDGNDRQTLIRESFHALSQYHYMALFITAPALMSQLLSFVSAQAKNKSTLNRLIGGSTLLFFVEFLGQQSLSFDNEIQAGPLLLWGLFAAALLGIILFTLNRLRPAISVDNLSSFQTVALALSVAWAVYLLSYFLTLTPIDRNFLQLALTLADLASILSVSRAMYMAYLPR